MRNFNKVLMIIIIAIVLQGCDINNKEASNGSYGFNLSFDRENKSKLGDIFVFEVVSNLSGEIDSKNLSINIESEKGELILYGEGSVDYKRKEYLGEFKDTKVGIKLENNETPSEITITIVNEAIKSNPREEVFILDVDEEGYYVIR